jgi:predicted RND superfamily exporter protein
MTDLREAQALSLEIADLADHAANEFLAQASMIGLISDDLPRITLLVLLVVTLIVTLDLRRIRLVMIAIAGLLFSLIWAAGALVLAGVQINLFNVVALPMMLGIGIDTLVHLLHRLRERNDTAAALRSTGLSALLSTLTSVAAFFALTLAVSRGVRSIGEAVVVGLTAVFLSAIVFVPATWRLLQPRVPRQQQLNRKG